MRRPSFLLRVLSRSCGVASFKLCQETPQGRDKARRFTAQVLAHLQFVSVSGFLKTSVDKFGNRFTVLSIISRLTSSQFDCEHPMNAAMTFRSQFILQFTAIVAALVWMCGSPAAVLAQNPDQIDLPEITRRLTEWRSSFVNLRLVYELRSLETTTREPLTEWPAPADPQSARLFARSEWIWADHGLDLLEDRYFHVPGGIRNVDVFNGPKGVVFRAEYRGTPEGKEELKELELSGLSTGKGTRMKACVATEGLY